jgi:DNA-binding response OmpR family regulator
MNIQFDKIFPYLNIDGTQIFLSKREWSVFILLWENKGKICTRDILLSRVWGDSHFTESGIERATILRIRRKLSNTALHNKLVSIKGFGYSLKI